MTDVAARFAAGGIELKDGDQMMTSAEFKTMITQMLFLVQGGTPIEQRRMEYWFDFLEDLVFAADQRSPDSEGG